MTIEILKQKSNTLYDTFLIQLAACITIEQLEEIRLLILSRKGLLPTLMSTIKDLSHEDKRSAGPFLNELKNTIEQSFYQKKEEIINLQCDQKEKKYKDFDITAYKLPYQNQGSLHLYTHVTNQIEDIFMSMGYEVIDGPEVETEYYNFEALNVPNNHPARDMQDTFWLKIPHMLLRTHTSNVQIREMQKRTPPFALISIGKVYRYEATDASHDYSFRQFEGLVVQENVKLSDLQGTLQEFLKHFFETESLSLRIRPGYFPFVEPGIEIDMSCPFCTSGCPTCKQSKWIECGGAGMVHPNVLKHGNINSTTFSAFAFGLGLTRLTMIKYKINDIRLLHTAQIDFLKQF